VGSATSVVKSFIFPEIKNDGGGDQYQDDPEKMEEGHDGSVGAVLNPTITMADMAPGEVPR